MFGTTLRQLQRIGFYDNLGWYVSEGNPSKRYRNPITQEAARQEVDTKMTDYGQVVHELLGFFFYWYRRGP
jgi:hypothetical protein